MKQTVERARERIGWRCGMCRTAVVTRGRASACRECGSTYQQPLLAGDRLSGDLPGAGWPFWIAVGTGCAFWAAGVAYWLW